MVKCDLRSRSVDRRSLDHVAFDRFFSALEAPVPIAFRGKHVSGQRHADRNRSIKLPPVDRFSRHPSAGQLLQFGTAERSDRYRLVFQVAILNSAIFRSTTAIDV